MMFVATLMFAKNFCAHHWLQNRISENIWVIILSNGTFFFDRLLSNGTCTVDWTQIVIVSSWSLPIQITFIIYVYVIRISYHDTLFFSFSFPIYLFIEAVKWIVVVICKWFPYSMWFFLSQGLTIFCYDFFLSLEGAPEMVNIAIGVQRRPLCIVSELYQIMFLSRKLK